MPAIIINPPKAETHVIDLTSEAPNRVVAEGENITVVIDYPLRDEVICHYQGPLTARELHGKIMESYMKIYKEEDETSTQAVVPLEERMRRGGLINRNTTNGVHGIWGHDLSDLFVHTATLGSDGVYGLGVDS
jgi:hypothetical protein